MFPRQSWKEHLQRLRWRQGEHVLIAAPNGGGKTTLAQQLVQRRSHVVTFATKPYDRTLNEEFADWSVVRKWDDIEPYMDRVIIWPKREPTLRATIAKQKEVFADAFDRIMTARGWCVLVDEMHYMTDRQFVGLWEEIALLHHVGRSSGITMVTLTQRPAFIPKIIYSSAIHAYIARTRDPADLKRLSELAGFDPRVIAKAVYELPNRHDYLYLNPQGDSPPVIVNTRM